MKISYNWLKELIDIDCTPQETAELLTGCGLEVDGLEKYESLKGGLAGIVVGQVITCEKHPNADRLRVTTVDIGAPDLLHIVCGAPNVAAGQKVLVATVGTTVHPTKGEPFEIKKSRIRGEASEGMICAEDELGLGESHDGILVLPAHYEVGEKASTYFPVYEDHLIEIGLTANRGDAASHLGVARDLRALTGKAIRRFEAVFPASSGKLPIAVQVEDTASCPRYSGISIMGIEVKESPDWLKNKLRVIGLNPINNIVDITNYVMHELGQPLHAFDADAIEGGRIKVMKLAAGTKFTTLDKVERTLNGNECMICDNNERPLAIAGVFGGLHSGVNSSTKNIFIESAYFNAASVRKTAKAHGLSTDASFRYERGTDPDITLTALSRAVELIQSLAGGQVASEPVDVYPAPVEHAKINFSIPKFHKLIGQEIPVDVIARILTGLDIAVSNADHEHLALSVPPYRSDVKREADIAEEVLRIYGLNNIAIPSQLKSTLSRSEDEDAFLLRNRLADHLSNTGFLEMTSNSLTRSGYYTEEEQQQAVKLKNPLSSDLDIMRMSMLFNGLEMIQYNSNRRIADIKAYEYGLTYRTQNGAYVETPHIAIYLTGKKQAESWSAAQQDTTYYTLKTTLANVLTRAGMSGFTFEPAAQQGRYLRNAMDVMHKGCKVAEMGEVDATLTKPFDISQPVYFADVLWSEVRQANRQAKFVPAAVSAFPSVRRDLALLLDTSVRYAEIERIARKSEPKLIKAINAFDVYEGDKIGAGKKSYAVSFILQDEAKTLTEQEIDGVMSKLIKNFEKELGATLRS